MNRHQFQQAAKSFRAGKIPLEDFTKQAFDVLNQKSKDTLSFGSASADQQGPSGVESTTDATISNKKPGQPSRQIDQIQNTLSKLANRPADSHKGDFGRCMIIGGCLNMPGAPFLAGFAALRCGAGLVTIATAKDAQGAVSHFHPAIMSLGLACDDDGFISQNELENVENSSQNDTCAFRELISSADCIAIGPGLGQSHSVPSFVVNVIQTFRGKKVIDADGLNAIASLSDDKRPDLAGSILTPHPGEFKRLFPESQSFNRASMEDVAKEKARQLNATIVLKGNHTFVTNGNDEFRNPTGNPGMATAGSGDVLTGIIAGLLGQGVPIWDAVTTGVFLHGKAGDIAAQRIGQPSLVCTDIVESLPSAFR